jgi:HK97 family phage major capsid protein
VSALVTNVTTYGAEHIFTQQGEFVDLLRNESKVLTAGARMLTNLRGPVSFPKLTAGATFYWMAENSGTDATASPPTTGLTTLIPKQLIANVPVSRQFLAESGVDGEAMVRSDMVWARPTSPAVCTSRSACRARRSPRSRPTPT